MTASQLANRTDLSDRIEHHLESAAPQLPEPPAEVIVRFDTGMDLDLLVGDDDLEDMQAEEEGLFFSQQQQMRGSREARRAYRNW